MRQQGNRQVRKKVDMQKRGAILAMLGGICWGFSGTCGQFLFSHTDVTVLVLSCARMLIGGSILTVIGFLKNREHQAKSRQKKTRLPCT